MKAQIFSLDFIFSVAVFSTSVILIFFAWNYTNIESIENMNRYNAERLALSISDSLIRTPGIPEDWDETNAITIGLAESKCASQLWEVETGPMRCENVISPKKLDSLIAMNYPMSKKLMGISDFEYYIEISDINGTVLKNTTVPISDPSIIVPVERFCIYENNTARAKFVLWRK